MNKRNKLHFPAKNWILGFIAAGFVFAAAFAYMSVIGEGIREDVSGNLRQMARQSVALIQERIRCDCMQLIGAAASIAQGDGPINDPNTLLILNDLSGNTNFDRIDVAGLNGDVYSSNGKSAINISTRLYFTRSQSGETVVSDLMDSLAGNGTILVISTPIRRGGDVIGVLVGQYEMDKISELLQIDYYDGQGYSYIAKSDGAVLFRSDNPHSETHFNNVFSDITKRHADYHSFDQIRQDMRACHDGEIFYEWNGTRRIMNYTPLGINDWYLLSVLPTQILIARTFHLFRQSLVFAMALVAIFGCAFLYAFHTGRKNRLRLIDTNSELTHLYNALPGGVFRCRYNSSWTVTYANQGFYRFLGYSPEQFDANFHNSMAKVIHPDDLQTVSQSVKEQLKNSNNFICENRLLCSNNRIKWVWINAQLIRDKEKDRRILYCMFVDITSLKNAQEQIRLDQERYEIVLNQSNDIVFEWNILTRVMEFSKNIQKRFNYPLSMENFPECILERGSVHPEDVEPLKNAARLVETEGKYIEIELRLRNPNDEFAWYKASCSAVPDEKGRPIRAVGILSNIDRQKQQLLSIEESAKRDPLTGLYNKGAFETAARGFISDGMAGPAAWVMLDVDNFKGINDTYGHPVGDEVLQNFARVLSDAFPAPSFAGRIGGDEFSAVLPGVQDAEVLAARLTSFTGAVRARFGSCPGGPLVTCSIGGVLFPRHGTDYVTLLRKADTALYHAKDMGKNCFFIFEE